MSIETVPGNQKPYRAPDLCGAGRDSIFGACMVANLGGLIERTAPPPPKTCVTCAADLQMSGTPGTPGTILQSLEYRWNRAIKTACCVPSSIMVIGTPGTVGAYIGPTRLWQKNTVALFRKKIASRARDIRARGE
jgi:hypothetical protein